MIDEGTYFGTAAVKTWPAKVVTVAGPAVPVATVIAGPPMEETTTTGVPETTSRSISFLD